MLSECVIYFQTHIMGTQYAIVNAVATGKGREVDVLGNKKLRTSLQKTHHQCLGTVPAASTKMKRENTRTGVINGNEIHRKGMNVLVRILAINARKGIIIADDAVGHQHPKERGGMKTGK